MVHGWWTAGAILPKNSFYILLLSVAFVQIPAVPVTSNPDCARSLSPGDGVGQWVCPAPAFKGSMQRKVKS
ncbi:uncharacterized protein HD556DRAFT_1427727 [Suillus plorans]|uniref:Uncharacterized protein n=1 Tax=Suillus plorans TaxID=116603 RepID=A0A9P7A8G3_9AGAM|nr:uncharacterized protein HD556DRAFT_1427727 [Suillus plorans]KAG1784429.1 hypothetical protein HD556DRAFT_1427727 [Suillus plorans]